jgi:beta-glucuronidase
MLWLYIFPVAALLIALAMGFHFFGRISFHPPAVDREEHNLQVKRWAGIPYLEENGLPYPGYFIASINPRLCLDGLWLLRADKAGKGEGEQWFAKRFTQDESEIAEVPGCFNTADSPLHGYEGAVWYQKVFTLNDAATAPGRWLRLAFMGSFYKTDVWLNGFYLGCSENGYLPFYFDADQAAVRDGENVLTVRVDNTLDYDSLPPKLYEGYRLGWHPFGGIHKSVYLEACPQVTCFKLRTETAVEGGTGVVSIQALFQRRGEISAPLTVDSRFILAGPGGDRCAQLEAKAVFAAGESVGGVTAQLQLPDPALWDIQSPHLYSLTLESPGEKKAVTFGFRSVAVEGTRIKINGEHVFFKGISRHEEDRPDGLAMKPEATRRELELIREMNGNFVRLAHYPHHPATLDSCDHIGLYAWEEIPLYQAGGGIVKYIGSKSVHDRKVKSFRQWPALISLTSSQLLQPALMIKARASLLKMVERDANHPSIVFWGIGNENWSINPAGEKALRWLKAELLQFDRTRPVTYASFTLPVVTAAFERSFNVADIIAVNEYYGWYYGKPGQEEKFIEKIHRKYPGKPILVSETGSDCVYGLHTDQSPPPWGHTEEYQHHMLKTKWENLSTKPYFAGWSPWILKDFYCPEYREDNPVPFYNLKGLMDHRYRKKKAFYLLQSLYGDRECP